MTNIDLKGSDAYMVNAGVDFTWGGGFGLSVQAVLINQGDDQGIYAYGTASANIGVSAGAGITYGAIDFNEDNSKGAKLNRSAFEGKGETVSASYGVVAAAYSYANTDGKWHTNPLRSDKLYEGVLKGVGAGIKAGLQIAHTNSWLIGGKKFGN